MSKKIKIVITAILLGTCLHTSSVFAEPDSYRIVGVTKINHVEDAAKAISVMLTEEEISLMEKTADVLGLSTIRFWEKKME